MISIHFQGKPFNITVMHVYAPNSNAEEAKVERFYEDLQDLLELTPQKDVLFIIGDWNAKVESQEIPGCCCCCIASVVSNSVRPHRRQPTRLPVPGILQARTLNFLFFVVSLFGFGIKVMVAS